MHGNDAVIAHLLGRRQRGGQLGGMVGVVIDDDCAVALALDLKAAARAVELLGCANGVLGLEAQRAHAAAHGQRIVNVVVAGHAQLDVGEVLTEFEDIELKEAGLVLADVDGAETGLLLDAEAQDRTVNGVHDVHRVLVVHVKDNGAGQQRKLLERQLELAHRAVIFQMVVVNVQDDAHRAGQMQEGLVVLTGFDDNALAAAGLAVAADQGQLAADDRRRVPARQLQHCGDHAGGRRLAVGACHADALGMGTADVAQHDAALNGFDAAGAGSLQLGVIVMDGGAVDHKVRVADVGGVMPDADAHAEGTLGLGVFGFLDVRAGDGIAAAVQDLDQRIGAGAAAADEMDRADAFEQLGVIHTKNHNSGHLKIYPLP